LEKKLINYISRVEALVSNNGTRIVAIDNWHSLGYGIDVFVVYNEKENWLNAINLMT
tara:strand:- start:294 stop:464 length:171 start_codon:yes stop_codon:yes gene_type:complete